MESIFAFAVSFVNALIDLAGERFHETLKTEILEQAASRATIMGMNKGNYQGDGHSTDKKTGLDIHKGEQESATRKKVEEAGPAGAAADTHDSLQPFPQPPLSKCIWDSEAFELPMGGSRGSVLL